MLTYITCINAYVHLQIKSYEHSLFNFFPFRIFWPSIWLSSESVSYVCMYVCLCSCLHVYVCMRLLPVFLIKHKVYVCMWCDVIGEQILEVLLKLSYEKKILKSALLLLCKLVYMGKYFSCSRLITLGKCGKVCVCMYVCIYVSMFYSLTIHVICIQVHR